jgi:hypothetical protein
VALQGSPMHGHDNGKRQHQTSHVYLLHQV